MKSTATQRVVTSNNYTQMLIQAQEQKNLVQRLVNLKPTVDNR